MEAFKVPLLVGVYHKNDKWYSAFYPLPREYRDIHDAEVEGWCNLSYSYTYIQTLVIPLSEL